MKAKYYYLRCADDDALGVAYAPPEYRFDLLWEGQYQERWKPVRFILRDGEYADYQANDLGWPLCSPKLRLLLAEHASAHDVLQWLGATVIAGGSEVREYHILNLPERPDVLHKRKTMFGSGGGVVKPHFDADAVRCHSIFGFRKGGFGIIVSAGVREAILLAGCTGVDFYQVPVS